MHLAGPTSWIAPLATGHPLGLPQDPRKNQHPQRVAAVPDGQLSSTFDKGQTPASFWRMIAGKPDPASHVAPPSIMQLEISRLLDDQAQAHIEMETDPQSAGSFTKPHPGSPGQETEQLSDTDVVADLEDQEHTQDSEDSLLLSSVFSTLP